MGRKIPGKKHRGVKDPNIQHARREESLKFKINAPPSKPDEQEIPKSLERVMLLKQMTKEGKFNKKRKRNRTKNKLVDAARLMGRELKLPGMTKPDKVMPRLVQRPGEDESQFISRVGRVTEEIINEIKFEEQFKVNVKRNAVSGDVEKVEKRREDEVDAMFEKKRMELMKSKNKKKLKASDNTKLSKSAKLRLKKAAKKQRKLEDEINENEIKHVDHVGFGEVVHQPPQLTVRPKKAVVTDMDNKPGYRSNLLLNSMLNAEGKKKASGKVLSMHDRKSLETERNNAIIAYRKLKASRKL